MQLLKILFFSFLLRLIVSFFSQSIINYDIQSYLKVGELTFNKVNIYPDIAKLHHPYFPFFLYLEALAFYLKQINLHPILFLKTIFILFDIGIAYLIFRITKDLKTVFIYGINPVSILVTAFHGQFDSIPLFFLILGIHFFYKKQTFFSYLSLSTAITIKTWPVIFIIPILKKTKYKIYFLIILIFPLLSILVYSLIFQANMEKIILTILKYQSLFGFFGVGKIISIFKPNIYFQRLFFLIFFISFLIFALKLKKKKIENEIFSLILFFYSITTHFAIQYLMWIVPFLLIIKFRFWKSLIFFISFFLIISYLSWCLKINLTLAQTLTGFLLWLVFLKMLYYQEKNID